MPDSNLELEIRQIEPGDRLVGLSIGDAKYLPLKTFVQRDAQKYHAQKLARTYAAFEGTKLRAYMTLVCGEVAIQNGDDRLVEDQTYRYLHYPALKIARLLVDSSMRGSGLGKNLVQLSIGIAKDIICPAVGCRFVMVDSKQDSVSFYEKCGFALLATDANRALDNPVMFIDLHKLD